jgi:lipooligosaccharide transport system ATP-binding protein
MKRRLTIARSLINSPELLLLDEPTTGLDPQARHVLWDRLFRLKRQGVTLIITTHYMDEAEQLCDRLVVMDQGRIVAEGSPARPHREHSTREVVELRFAMTARRPDHTTR